MPNRMYHLTPLPSLPPLFGGYKILGILAGNTRPQHTVAIGAAVSLMFALAAPGAFGKVLYLALVIGGWAALNRIPYNRGSIEGNAKPKLADAIGLQLRWRKRPKDYVSEANAGGQNSATGDDLPIPAPAEVGHQDWIAAHQDDGTEVGILRSRDTGRTRAWLEVVPPGFGIAAEGDRDGAAANFHTVTKRFTNRGFTDTIIELVDVRPLRSTPLPAEDVARSAPTVHPAIAAERWPAVEMMGDTPVHRSYRGISIPSTAGLRRASKLKGKGDVGLAAIVIEELTALADGLTDAGYTVLGPLNIASLVTLTRGAWDPDRDTLPTPNTSGAGPRLAYPIHREEPKPNYVKADGWYSSASEVMLPTTPQRAGFDSELVTKNPTIRRRHVAYRRLIAHDEALDRAERVSATSEIVQDDADTKGENHGVRQRRATTTAATITTALASGDIGTGYVEYVIVHATNPTELSDHERVIARSSSRPIEPLYKDHARGISYGTPMGEGLRP